MIDVAELAEAREFLDRFTPWQLERLVDVLLPAAEEGAAGPYSLMVLELIADQLDDRLRMTAAA